MEYNIVDIITALGTLVAVLGTVLVAASSASSKSFNELRDVVSILQEERKDDKLEIERLQKQVDKYEQDLAALQTKLAAVLRERDELQLQVNEQNAEIGRLQERIIILENRRKKKK